MTAAGPHLAWAAYAQPQHVTQWNAASDDWCCPRAENDPRPLGRFNYRMESRDGKFGFDFTGVFTVIEAPTRLAYKMDDGRAAEVSFRPEASGTQVTVTFEAEAQNSLELQRQGWQAILDRFAAYAGTLTE